MSIVLNIILLLVCSFTFYEDWKYRGVSWPIFPVLLVVTLWLQFISINLWLNFLLNLVFIILVLLSLTLYLTIKEHHLVNIFKAYFGLGDALFLIVISPLFVNQNFILFFITGMFLSGLIHLIVFKYKPNPKIPLAGYLGIYLNLWLLIGWLTNENLFTTRLL